MLTAQDKQDIAGMVDVPVTDVQVNGTSVVSGGVANVPVLTENGQTAIPYVSGNRGITVLLENGRPSLGINLPSNNAIKGGTVYWGVIVPANQYRAVFYGLAAASGDTTQSASSNAVGQYTDAAKSAISTMLTSPVSVSGTTPTITALPGIRYVCGEVSTLGITLPESGCIDVTFTSGSTATVLTITPPTGQTVKWANGFDPTSLDANTTYEINIMDGLGWLDHGRDGLSETADDAVTECSATGV